MDIALAVDGQIFTGWKEVSITRSIRSLASTFRLSVTERWSGQDTRWQIRPGQTCTVTVAEHRAATGTVQRYAPSLSGSDHRVEIGGASYCIDLANSSVLVSGGKFPKYTWDAIARAVCQPYGLVPVIAAPVGAPFDTPTVTPGEEAGAFLTRLAADRGALLYDNIYGQPVFGLPSSGRAVGRLVEADTAVLECSADLSIADRFSEYIYRGQAQETPEFFGKDALGGEGRARDPGVTRYRPLIVTPSGSQDSGSLATRAAHERDRRIALGVTATVVMQGATQTPGGPLWDINQLVACDLPSLGLRRDMLIETVTLTKDNQSGTLTRLDLVIPESVDPKAESKAQGANATSWAGLIPNE